MKKIDKLLITSFFGPYLVTFFIALFVLVMQMLWLYIDDIAGKGVGFFLLIELIAYMSVSFFPMALAIAVLISSVMVLGNLAEHYELSSIKSAGVPLWRTVMPLAMVVFGIAVFSFFCSNNIIPVSNLKFKSRLYDIRRQKPALNLEEGTFNDDFQGFSIRIGEKGSDNRKIKNVLIYDQTEASKDGKVTVISAKEGEMYVTPDEKFFVMELRDGMQAYEPEPTNKKAGKKNAPFSRTYFTKWSKVFDLSQFELNRTSTDLFKSHHSMLTVSQLGNAIDSIDIEIIDRNQKLHEQISRFFYPIKKEVDDKKVERDKILVEARKAKEAATETTQAVDYNQYMNEESLKEKSTKNAKRKAANQETKSRILPLKQIALTKPLAEYTSIIELFEPRKRIELYDKAKSYSRTVLGQAESAERAADRIRVNRVKHVFEMHTKFSTAMACLIFLFIGAPMGAIIRKGGFGYPLLVSIIFFMIFIVVTIFSKNVAERSVIDARLAAWMNCLVLLPFCFILTYQAMTDKQVFNFSRISNFFNAIAAFFKKEKEA